MNTLHIEADAFQIKIDIFREQKELLEFVASVAYVGGGN